ncbi:hypothetical protein Tco_0007806 [Tanacetum coccineum]
MLPNQKNPKTSCEYSSLHINDVNPVLPSYELKFARVPRSLIKVESYGLFATRRIRGTRGSGSNSTTTKSAGNWNFPTNTRTSLAIPIGVVIERSASSSVMHVGVSSEREISYTLKTHKIDACTEIGQGIACVNARKFTWDKESAGVSKFSRQLVKDDRRASFVQFCHFTQFLFVSDYVYFKLRRIQAKESKHQKS